QDAEVLTSARDTLNAVVEAEGEEEIVACDEERRQEKNEYVTLLDRARAIDSYDVRYSELFFFSSRRRHTSLQGDWSQTCALPICVWAADTTVRDPYPRRRDDHRRPNTRRSNPAGAA